MRSRTIVVLNLILLLTVVSAFGQGISRIPDPNFDAKIANPAYNEKRPKVLFDGAHFNENLSGGNYKGFLDLIRNDGYEVSLNNQKLSSQTLAGYNVLVIVNAAGANGLDSFDAPAFTEEECNAVRNWVNSGGSLLLVAGATPFGKAAENLAKQFGLEMSNGRTIDNPNKSPDAHLFSVIFFTRENNLLANSISRLISCKVISESGIGIASWLMFSINRTTFSGVSSSSFS